MRTDEKTKNRILREPLRRRGGARRHSSSGAVGSGAGGGGEPATVEQQLRQAENAENALGLILRLAPRRHSPTYADVARVRITHSGCVVTAAAVPARAFSDASQIYHFVISHRLNVALIYSINFARVADELHVVVGTAAAAPCRRSDDSAITRATMIGRCGRPCSGGFHGWEKLRAIREAAPEVTRLLERAEAKLIFFFLQLFARHESISHGSMAAPPNARVLLAEVMPLHEQARLRQIFADDVAKRIVRAGWLEKQPSTKSWDMSHSWSERYFVLTTRRLHRFVRSRNGETYGVFGTPSRSWDVVDIARVIPRHAGDARRLCVRLTSDSSVGVGICMRAKDEALMHAWAASLEYVARAARQGGVVSAAAAAAPAPLRLPRPPPSPPPPQWRVNTVCHTAGERCGGSGGSDGAAVLFAGALAEGADIALTGLVRAASLAVRDTDGGSASFAVGELLRGSSAYPLRVAVPLVSRAGEAGDAVMSCTVASRPTERKGPLLRHAAAELSTSRGALSTLAITWHVCIAVAVLAPALAAGRGASAGRGGAARSLALLGTAAIAFGAALRILAACGVLAWRGAPPPLLQQRGTPTFDLVAAFTRAPASGVGGDIAAAAAGNAAAGALAAPVAAPAPPLMQCETLPRDAAARMAGILNNGALETGFTATSALGTRESLPLDEAELIIADEIVGIFFQRYAPWRAQHVAKWPRFYALPAEANEAGALPGSAAAGTRHRGALRLDATMLTIFVRGHKRGGVNEVARWLARSLEWRVDPVMRIPTLLTEVLPYVDETFALWPSNIFGMDSVGHLIHAERIAEVEVAQLHAIYLAADHDARTGRFYDVLRVRAQILQTLWHLKRKESKARGHRILENILIVDFKDVSAATCKALLRARAVVAVILALGGENYPETMRRVYVVNAPSVFKLMWKIAKGMVDPITRDKTRISSEPSQCRNEMLADGVPNDAIPMWLGGTHPGVSLKDYAHEFVRANQLNLSY